MMRHGTFGFVRLCRILMKCIFSRKVFPTLPYEGKGEGTRSAPIHLGNHFALLILNSVSIGGSEEVLGLKQGAVFCRREGFGKCFRDP